MPLKSLFIAILTAALTSSTSAQEPRLDPGWLKLYADHCSQRVPYQTIVAITTVESGLHPYALSINYPQQMANKSGYLMQRIYLARQPQNVAEAVSWMRWFHAHGYTVSAGLMQVNTEMAQRFRISPEQLFDPCTNIAIGTAILNADYDHSLRIMPTPNAAYSSALSAYNTGSNTAGLTNGYVSKVLSIQSRVRQR